VGATPPASSSGDEEALPDLPDVDVRDFRARLVAQQRSEEGGAGAVPAGLSQEGGGGWIYETPLIEQGSVLLGGTKQAFGFGLRQQYFHKCVLLLVEHSPRFTKGIILNRPTALKWADGAGADWDVWFGGDVQEGGVFRQSRRHGPEVSGIEMLCLHRLDSPEAREVSTQVIKSIYSTTFEDAKSLVARGLATQKDFWLFFGYCGWAAGQLQSELNRDSWYMAAADSALLLDELLTQSSDPLSLPRLSAEGVLEEGGDGIGTWARLMRNIGRSEEVAAQAETHDWMFDDSMLREWIRQKLTARELNKRTAVAGGQLPKRVSIADGTLLRAGDWPGFILDRQFLYKSLLVILKTTSDFTLGAVINRPTATVAQLQIDADSEAEAMRRICFGGDVVMEGQEEVYLTLIPSDSAPGGCEPLGASGLSRLSDGVPDDLDMTRLLILRGLVYWDSDDLQDQISEGKYAVVRREDVPWQDLWDLSAFSPEDDTQDLISGSWTTGSLGVGVWQAVAESSAGAEGRGANGPLAGISLGDLALLEWAKVFSSGQP